MTVGEPGIFSRHKDLAADCAGKPRQAQL